LRSTELYQHNLAGAWLAADPQQRKAINQRVARHGIHRGDRYDRINNENDFGPQITWSERDKYWLDPDERWDDPED
jgi:hypothetical protein